MSLIVIAIFLLAFGYLVYYVINLLIRKRITEDFTDIQERFLNDEDSQYFLMRSILPGKIDIANLKPFNPHHTNFYYVDPKAVKTEQTDPNVVTHRLSALTCPSELTCIGPNHPIRQRIKERQPYMFDQPEIINYYDYPFYRDWRYPERPIDPRFAANAQKYCERNPQVYPCYRYYSKW